MVGLEKINIDIQGLSGNQIKLLKPSDFGGVDQLQSYITQINAIKTVSNGVFNEEAALNYAVAIEGLEPKQAALLLSTQGLSNAQIQQTLATQGLSQAEQYQAMLDAGLLKSKQQLTNVELQNNITKTLSASMSEEQALAKSKELMASMGLTVAEAGEDVQTVKLTSSKLAELIAEDKLTEAQVKEIAARTGVLVSTAAQTAAAPAWIAGMKAMALATWEQVKATAAWMVTNPAGQITMLVGVILFAVKVYNDLTLSVEEQKEKMADSLSAYKDAKNELSDITTELKNQERAMDDLLAKEKLTYAEQGRLAELQAITKELRIQKDLAEREEKRTRQEVAQDASDLFKKQFGKYEISENTIEQYEKDDYISLELLDSDTNDLSAMIAGYKKAGKFLDEALASKNQDDIEYLNTYRADLENNIFTVTRDLQEQQANIADYYNTLKDTPYDDLMPDEKEIVDSYNSISEAIELTYRQLDPDTWKSMQIENVFDTEGIEKTKEELVEMVKAGTFDENALQSYPRLSEALKQNKVSVSELRNELEALANDDTFNGIYPLPFTGFTEEQSKSIDDFQSKMQTLSTALSALRSGEDVGMTELLEQFPELAGQSENLEDAIITLIYGSLDELYGVLGEGLPDEARQDLQYLADTASGVAPDLNTAFASIQKSYSAMHEFKNAMDTGSLTESILSNVGSLSPYMNQLVAQFHSREINEEELYQALTEHYYTDLENYRNALIAKNLMNKEFYKVLVLTNADLFNNFSDNYGVDIGNCETYNEAKLKIESQTLGTLGDMWKQYYNIQADAYTPAMDALRNLASHGDKEANAQLADILKQVDAYRKAMEALDNITYDSIEKDFDKITSGLNKNNDESSSSIRQETEEIFDFIAIKIENLEKQISRLEETATDTGKSLKKRQNAYTDAISQTTSEIELQQQAYQKYMEKARSFGLSEEWAQKVRDGSPDISSVTDDALKEQIKSYQEWYKKAMECSDALDELAKKKRELETAKIQLEIDVKSDKLEKLENAYDKIENRISLSELFGGRASSGKYAALNKNLREQIRNLYEQNDLITKQAALVTKGSEAWEEYRKSIRDNESSVRKLMQTMAENAKAMAELTNEKTSDRIAGYDTEDDYYRAKSANQTGYRKQNAYLDKEIGSIQKRRKAYVSADTQNENALKNASAAVGKVKKDSLNKDILKEAEKYTKSGKEIPSSLLEKAAALKDGGTLYQAFVNYNAALAAYETGRKTRKLYEETSRADEAALIKQKADNIRNDYDNKQSRYSRKASEINRAMDMAQAQGYTISTKYYYQLINAEKKNNASLREEREKLAASLAEAVENGSVARYSDDWYKMQQAIDDVTDSISRSDLSLKEYENTLRQIKWDRFDTLQAKIGNLASEMDFMIKELSRDDLFSGEDGWLTKNGKAVSSLRASKYTLYRQQAEDYKKEIRKLEKDLAEDPYNQDLVKQKEALYKAYQQTVSAVRDEKDAITDLYQNGYDALLSRVGELISEYEELMDAEKSAYDYQQKIADATKNISSLRKQLDAYAGDTSEETRAKIQSLTVELAEAEKDLKDTQYDKMISATKDMLSDLQEDMNDSVQDIIDSLSENFDNLIKQINDNTDRDIISAITDKIDGIGYMSTDELDRILRTFYGFFYQDMSGNEDAGEWTDIIRATKDTIDVIREYWKQSAEEANKNAQGAAENIISYEIEPIVGGIRPEFFMTHMNQIYSPGLPTLDLSMPVVPSYPKLAQTINNNSFTFSGNIELPDVTNPKEFADALKIVVKNNPSVQNMLRDTTIGTLSSNHNSLYIRKY